jgi:hypothetical protein
MKWNVGYIFLETATLVYLFVHEFDPVRVIARFSLVALLSLGLSWWWEIKLRRRFLLEQQQLRHALSESIGGPACDKLGKLAGDEAASGATALGSKGEGSSSIGCGEGIGEGLADAKHHKLHAE